MQGDSAAVRMKGITCLHLFGDVGLKRFQVCKNSIGHVHQAGLNPGFCVVIQPGASGLRDTQNLPAR